MRHLQRRSTVLLALVSTMVALASCKTTEAGDLKDVGSPQNQSCKALRYMHTSTRNILQIAANAGRERACTLKIPSLTAIDADTTPATPTANDTSGGTAVGGDNNFGSDYEPVYLADAANSCVALADLVSRQSTFLVAVKEAWDGKNCSPAAEARERDIQIFDHPTCGPVEASATCSDNFNDVNRTTCYTCQAGAFNGKAASSSAITCKTEIEARAASGIWCEQNNCGGQPILCRVAGAAGDANSVVSDTVDTDTTLLKGETEVEVTVNGEVGAFGNSVELEGAVTVILSLTAKVEIINADQSSATDLQRDERTEYGANTTYACGFLINGSVATSASAAVEVGFKIPLTDTGATAGLKTTATGSIERELEFLSGTHPAGGKTRMAVLTDCLNRGKAQARAVVTRARRVITAFVRRQGGASGGFVGLAKPYVRCDFGGSLYGIEAVSWKLVPRQSPDYPDEIRVRIKTDNYFGDTESLDDPTHGIRIWSNARNVLDPGRPSFTSMWDTFAKANSSRPPSTAFVRQVLTNHSFLPVNHKWYYTGCR